jgi:hypothetical protein
MKKVILFFAIASIGTVACSKKGSIQTFDCAGVTPKYTTEIKPILDANCATSGCHNSASKAEGLDYSNYGQAKHHATHNEFLGSIQHVSGYEQMPKGKAKLTDAQIKLISCWSQNGAPE